jgi:hypothetical protein
MCSGGVGYGLTCRVVAVVMAGNGLAWFSDSGRWLPVWLPGVVSNAGVRMPDKIDRPQDRSTARIRPPGQPTDPDRIAVLEAPAFGKCLCADC